MALTTKHFPADLGLALVRPRVFVNGQQLPPAKWGRTIIPLPPGQHHLHVHTPYLFFRRGDPADLMVRIVPGMFAELEYRCGAGLFRPGSLGPPPQKYAGAVGYTVLLVAAALFVLIWIIKQLGG